MPHPIYSNSAISGTHCGHCEKLLSPDEPVYWTHVMYESRGGFALWDRGPVCKSCATADLKPGEYFIHSGKCKSCGREVYGRRGWHVYCSQRCRQKIYRPRKQTTYSTCEQCGESFMQKRSDSKYCSSKCRQKAYRQREVEA